MSEDKKARAKKIARVAAVAGALLGVACHFAPENYREACKAVAKATSLTVGGCS